jgi:DNA-binding MarR family transcriptional regulator
MILSSVPAIVPFMAVRGGRRAESLGQGLVRLAFAVDAAYTRASRELDLTGQQAQLLCALGLATGDDGRPIATNRPTPVGELAAELNCDQSNASRLVDRAAKRGLLVRRRDADGDARVTLVELTDDGRRHLEQFLAILQQQAIDPLFSDWPPERQAAALDVLNALADSLDDAT